MIEIFVSVGSGLVSGLFCLVAMKIDMGWMKKAIEKLDERLYNIEVRNMK